MSVRPLDAPEVEALLSSLAERDCGQGCKCVFCRTFEEGYNSGKHDAELHFRSSLEDFAKGVKL